MLRLILHYYRTSDNHAVKHLKFNAFRYLIAIWGGQLCHDIMPVFQIVDNVWFIRRNPTVDFFPVCRGNNQRGAWKFFSGCRVCFAELKRGIFFFRLILHNDWPANNLSVHNVKFNAFCNLIPFRRCYFGQFIMAVGRIGDSMRLISGNPLVNDHAIFF